LYRTENSGEDESPKMEGLFLFSEKNTNEEIL